MRQVNVSEVFKNILNLYDNEFESAKSIMLDFSNIDNLDLKGIKTLLSVQKVALINNKSIKVKNVAPSVGKILDITGLNKTFSDSVSVPVRK